jgi:hypothetical protein
MVLRLSSKPKSHQPSMRAIMVFLTDFPRTGFLGRGTSTGAGGGIWARVVGRGGSSSTGFGGSRMRTLFCSRDGIVGGGGNQGLGGPVLSGAVIPVSDSESLSGLFSGAMTAVPRLFFFTAVIGGGGKSSWTPPLPPRPNS